MPIGHQEEEQEGQGKAGVGKVYEGRSGGSERGVARRRAEDPHVAADEPAQVATRDITRTLTPPHKSRPSFARRSLHSVTGSSSAQPSQPPLTACWATPWRALALGGIHAVDGGNSPTAYSRERLASPDRGGWG